MPNINIRVTDSQKAELEARSDGNLSQYIKQQLFEQGSDWTPLIHRLDDLADDLKETIGQQPGSSDHQQLAILIELLLMMRITVKPDARRQAQAETKRQGLAPWEPTNKAEGN